MINHYFATLFNQATVSSFPVYNPLTEPLRIPALLNSFYEVFADPDLRAARCVKIVAASQLKDKLTAIDSRITFDPSDLILDEVNTFDFIDAILRLPPATVNAALFGAEDLYEVYRESSATQDVAAAVIVGIVEKVTANNG